MKVFIPMKSFFANFFKMEASGGICLILAAAFAILLANSPLASYYDQLLHVDFGFVLGDGGFKKPVLFWVNDVLMVVFFFLIGLEVKREFIEGELSSWRQAILPIMAAIGGILAPALVFYLINIDHPENMAGWAIPTATDIAFALGVLALLGSRVPLSLKVFLTAIAIIDDLAAIIVIAIFYTGGLKFSALLVGAIFMAGLVALNRFRVISLASYLLLGLGLWVCIKIAGMHPTLAGVLVALCIPLSVPDRRDPERTFSPSKRLEHNLHGWVAFGVLPIFGFANAGVSFSGMTLESLFDPLTLGIATGLFFGKQIGIFALTYICVLIGLAQKPKQATWLQVYAVALLCGIGFTMSLFIGMLAFPDPGQAAPLRLGVIAGSVISAVMGYLILRYAPSHSSLAGVNQMPSK